MTEQLTLLRIRGGTVMATKHTPAPRRFSNNRWQTLTQRIDENHGIPPALWTALCGASGILYRADAAVFAGFEDCFGCRCQMNKRPSLSGRRYTNDEDRLAARRQTWRDSKRRKAAAAA